MKAAICTGFDHSIAFAREMAMIREAGFEVIALGARPEHTGYATIDGRSEIRRLLRQYGMTVDSVHAPFPEGDRLFSLDQGERAESIRQCQVAIDAAGELDGRTVVIHLIQPYGIPHGERRDRMIEAGRQSLAALADYAEPRGVNVALENGQKRDYDDVLASLLTEFTGAHIGFCYDSGHEHVQGTCFRMLGTFGHRLKTLHIHDNQGSDTHVLPFEGTIDWAQFRTVLHGLDYAGNVLLEADIARSAFKEPSLFLSRAKACAEWLLRPGDDSMP